MAVRPGRCIACAAVDPDRILETKEAERVHAEVEGGFMKNFVDPRLPSPAEQAAHALTHVPYRNWCDVCVRAKGRDLDHRTAVCSEHQVPEFSFDFCFPGDEEGNKLVVLVGRERKTGMMMAVALPDKSSGGALRHRPGVEFSG